MSDVTPSEAYHLRWNNYQWNLISVFENLLQTEAFTDVTLVVYDEENHVTRDEESSRMRFIKCHKIVLAACSTYFQSLFINLPSNSEPLIVLNNIKYTYLKILLEFMYRGEVDVHREQLKPLLETANTLAVKGLMHENKKLYSAYNDFQQQEDTLEAPSSPPPAISTSTNASSMAAHSSSHVSPPHSTYGSLYAKSLGTTSEINPIQNPLFWPLTTLPLHGVSTSHQLSPHSSPVVSIPSGSAGGGSSSYDIGFETSPLKRMKKVLHSSLLTNRDTPILRTVLGQGHADSSVTGIPLLQPDNHESAHFRTNSNDSVNDNDNRRNTDLGYDEMAHSSYTDPSMDEDEKQPSPQSHTGDNKSSNTTQAKPEWKRYKQYTRDDIQAAIQAVRSGMSAVKAARRYGVPSRTLYDKVKKLGIPTSRPFKRSVNGGSTACFPYGIGGNVNGRIYSNSILSENENEASNNINIENLASSTSSTSATYIKPASKDVSQDRDSMSDSITRYSPSPVICCVKQKQPPQNVDDEVEDLSVSRKSDGPGTMTSEAVKDPEPQESGSQNSDYCDYS